jgi:hypothetical protein
LLDSEVYPADAVQLRDDSDLRKFFVLKTRGRTVETDHLLFLLDELLKIVFKSVFICLGFFALHYSELKI